jgi:hypothetical protein
MNDEPIRTSNMVDITDCFEAVRVFRVWRNLFFVLLMACLLVVQTVFWLVDMGFIKHTGPSQQVGQEVLQDQPLSDSGSSEGNPPASQAQPRRGKGGFLGISFEHVARLIRVANGVLLLAALLYWLTQFFILVISIVGRLGGMNHICRAFFLSLIVLVLVIPWQHILDSILVGVPFSAQELTEGLAAKTLGVYERVVYYLRFSGYGLIVLALLILAHLRSRRWTKTILRRLEII